MRKGFAGSVLVVAIVAGAIALAATRLSAPPVPSPALFEALGQTGVGLLIAYSVAFAAGERVLSERATRKSHEDWLGVIVGLAVCVLIGIGLGFGLAEHRRQQGPADTIDWLGLCWTLASIGLMGVLVALQPLMSYEWRKLPPRRRWRVERLRAGASRPRTRGA